MRIFMIVWALASAIPVSGAQPPSPPSSPPEATVLLSQCGPVDETTRDLLTPGPRSLARWMRWTDGTTVLTSGGHRIRVVGRLVPSANIAAQIGDIDPTVQTMAILAGAQNRSGLEITRPPTIRLAPPPPAPLRVMCPR